MQKMVEPDRKDHLSLLMQHRSLVGYVVCVTREFLSAPFTWSELREVSRGFIRFDFFLFGG